MGTRQNRAVLSVIASLLATELALGSICPYSKIVKTLAPVPASCGSLQKTDPWYHESVLHGASNIRADAQAVGWDAEEQGDTLLDNYLADHYYSTSGLETFANDAGILIVVTHGQV